MVSGQMCRPVCADSSAKRIGSITCNKSTWVSDLPCSVAELCLAKSGSLVAIQHGPMGLIGAGLLCVECDLNCEFDSKVTTA